MPIDQPTNSEMVTVSETVTASCDAVGGEDVAASKSPTPVAGTGFATLASRISQWTTNLLLTATILLVAVLLGGRLTQMWKPMPAVAQPDSIPFAFLEDRSAPVQLRFGNTRHTMTRRNVAGSRQTVLDQLCDACADSARHAGPRSAPATQSEQDLVSRLGKSAAIRTIDPSTHVYRLDAALPIFVAVRNGPADQSQKAAGDSVSTARVVTWGVVAPGLEGGWNIYTFSPLPRTEGLPADKAVTETQAERFVPIPLPPAADHLLSITSADGAAVMAFRGTDGPDRWAQFFDDWLDSRDGQTVIPWQTSEQHWSARYRRIRLDGAELIDIQIRRSSNEAATPGATPQWYGIVTQSFTEAGNK